MMRMKRTMQRENKPSQRGKQQTSTRKARKDRARAQDLLAYQALADSGLMWLGGSKYSVTLALSDINYALAPESVQHALVERYAHFLNGHTADIGVQISIVNRVLDSRQLARDVELGLRADEYDVWRKDYNELIRARLDTGRNNTVTDKYVTLTVNADSPQEARIALARIASEDAASLREVGGCEARQLTGDERVRLLTSMLRPRSAHESFSFTELVGQTMTTKDVVCPFSIETGKKDQLTMSDGNSAWVWKSFVLRRLPPWLSDRLLKELADIPVPLTVSVHLNPIDQAEGLKMVKAQIASMDIQRSNEQRKLVKQQLSADLIPHELQNSYDEAAELRRQLEQSNEKLFDTTIIVAVRGEDASELATNVDRVVRACAKHSCTLELLTYMHVDAMNAVLPLGVCNIPVSRTLTTSSAAILVPFTSQEVLTRGGLFYGINALSKNLIVADRSTGMNANGFILGTSGSGKSQFAKFEMMQMFLRYPNDEILIIDPEREYPPLASALNASRVIISAGSKDSINALDLDKTLATSEADPVRDKAQFVLAMCEVLLGGTDGLTPVQRSIIDRVATQILRDYWLTDGALQPTLRTLYDALRSQSELEARQLAAGLEIYAIGSFSGFAQETNIDPRSRVVVYDLADLQRTSQTFGMMIVLEDVWARIRRNKSRGVRTWVYIDEFHLLFENDYAAEYCQAMFKRVRKYGAGATGITQNIEELLANQRARLMLSNSDSLFMLNQQPTDADELQELMQLSDQQRGFAVNARPGCGLMKLGGVVIPFDNTMRVDSQIFTLFSTSICADRGDSRD